MHEREQQIGTDERLEKLRVFELAEQAEREAGERVKLARTALAEAEAAYHPFNERMSQAVREFWGRFPGSGIYVRAPEPAKPPELTQREHEVWLTAYSASCAAHAPHGVMPGSPSRSEVAAAAAREAVDGYRMLVSGGAPLSAAAKGDLDAGLESAARGEIKAWDGP